MVEAEGKTCHVTVKPLPRGVLDNGMIQSVFDRGRIRADVLSGVHPFFCPWFVKQRMAAKDPAKLERLLDDLRKAGWK